MNPARVPALQSYFAARSGGGVADAEERARIENFLWDERPQERAVDLYAQRLGNKPVADLDEWSQRHKFFVRREVQIGQGKPEIPLTFRDLNEPNRLRQIEPNLTLIRVEDAARPCELAGISVERLREAIDGYQRKDKDAIVLLEGLLERWNAKRDRRPQFATTEMEVEDILDDRPDWAERLRDRLGLGHYDPGQSGKPSEIILMRYTVGEVLAAVEGNQGHPAIPTLLDGNLSAHFVPTPFPAPSGSAGANWRGHTLNLTPGANPNTYRMGVELLHPAIAYKPEHFFRVGIIAQPVGMSITTVRSFHLPWLRLEYDRDDFAPPVCGETT